MSDHGKSLGEYGLTLHGIPHVLAPRERPGIDTSCLGARQRAPLSHDHLFHSILSLSNVRTALYRPERGLFRQCQS